MKPQEIKDAENNQFTISGDGLRVWRGEFFPPLSAEENNKLIQAYRQEQNSAKRTQIRDILVYGNMGIVRKVLSRTIFTKDEWEREDLLQEGIFTMLKTIEEYDPDIASFSTLLYNSLKNAYRSKAKLLKRQAGPANVVGFDKSTRKDDYSGRDLRIGDFLEEVYFDESWALSKVEVGFLFDKILPMFSETEQQMFKKYYVEGFNLTEIAKFYDVKHQRVSQILSRMVKDIQKICEKGGDAELSRTYAGLCERPLPKNATLKDVLNAESVRNRQIFEGYQQGRKLKDIAATYSINPSTAHHVIKKVLTTCEQNGIAVANLRAKQTKKQSSCAGQEAGKGLQNDGRTK